MAGYLVRLIGLWKPWIPTEVALYASPGELAAIGVAALAGGWIGVVFFWWIWLGQSVPMKAPWYILEQTWRDYGVTPARARRIKEGAAASLATLRPMRWPRRRRVRRRLTVAIRRRTPLPRPRLLSSVLRVALAALLVGTAVSWIVMMFNGTFGVSLGSALQVIAMYWGWWRLSVISKHHGRVDLLRVIPTAVIVVLGAGIGAGINYSFAHRPALYSFATTAGLEDGTYQQIGSNDGFAYLVPCGPPIQEAVVVVQQSHVITFKPAPSFETTRRNSLLDTLTRAAPLDAGYRACQ